ncbi:MAG: endonuclease domain-containing protein, partial [Rhizomicrobium sp.]
EKRLWWKLRELNQLGYHFRRQVPFRSYFLGFDETRSRGVNELEGSQHGLAGQRERDAFRDEILRREGYKTLRF